MCVCACVRSCVCPPQDLKDEKKKARMAAARAVLEKCTMMLLTASKVNCWCTSIGTEDTAYSLSRKVFSHMLWPIFLLQPNSYNNNKSKSECSRVKKGTSFDISHSILSKDLPEAPRLRISTDQQRRSVSQNALCPGAGHWDSHRGPELRGEQGPHCEHLQRHQGLQGNVEWPQLVS